MRLFHGHGHGHIVPGGGIVGVLVTLARGDEEYGETPLPLPRGRTFSTGVAMLGATPR